MLPEVAEFVIQGITIEGEVFQSPDWSVKLCDSLGGTGAEGRTLYSAYVRPSMIDGVASLVVRNSLKRVDEKAFQLIKQFVSQNRLQVRAGRGSRDAEETGKYPALEKERRSPENNRW